MATGPPVQDFRLLLPGYREDCPVEIDIFIEGYEIFRDFGQHHYRIRNNQPISGN
jgi:hypothetical protein